MIEASHGLECLDSSNRDDKKLDLHHHQQQHDNPSI
jgi:hypothetical protein